MSRRYKPVGWRGEPHRHYLAAKGIRTSSSPKSLLSGGFDFLRNEKTQIQFGVREKNRRILDELGVDEVWGSYDFYLNDEGEVVAVSGTDSQGNAFFKKREGVHDFADVVKARDAKGMYFSKKRKIRGRFVDISREAMLEKVSDLQEFQEGAEQEGISVDEFVGRSSTEELGAILGYWDVNDGSYREWVKPYSERDPGFIEEQRWLERMRRR